MSDTLILGLATLVVGLISPLLILYVTHTLNKKTNDKVDEYHKEVNSKLSQLVVAEKDSSRRQGKEEGKQEEKADQKSKHKTKNG